MRTSFLPSEHLSRLRTLPRDRDGKETRVVAAPWGLLLEAHLHYPGRTSPAPPGWGLHAPMEGRRFPRFTSWASFSVVASEFLAGGGLGLQSIWVVGVRLEELEAMLVKQASWGYVSTCTFGEAFMN